jgi:hypothetical protein
MDDFDMGLLDDTSYKVNVLRQKMLGIAPVFMYRVPKEQVSGQEYLYVPSIPSKLNRAKQPMRECAKVAASAKDSVECVDARARFFFSLFVCDGFDV